MPSLTINAEPQFSRTAHHLTASVGPRVAHTQHNALQPTLWILTSTGKNIPVIIKSSQTNEKKRKK